MTAADKTLKIIAILIGFLIVSSRFPGFIWPDRFKNAFRRYTSLGNGIYRAIGVLLIILSISLIYLVTSHSPHRNPLRIAGLFIGFASLGTGWLHLHPELLRKAFSAASSRLGGRTGKFLTSYSSITNAVIITVALLLIGIGIGILYITHLPVTPDKFIVLYAAFVVLVTGVTHFYPKIVRKLASKIAERSSAAIRWANLTSTILILIIIIWAILYSE